MKDKPLIEKIQEWIKNNKTSWKYLKNHGFKDSESYGDCIFLNFRINGINDILSPKEELNKIIKEAVEKLKEDIIEAINKDVGTVEWNNGWNAGASASIHEIDKIFGDLK